MTRRIVGMLVLLGLFGWSEASAQMRQVSGRVVSEEAGNPLSAASVFVAGTSIGTVTDAQGNFSLQAPAGEMRLRVALIGYRTEDVTVPAGQSSVTVALAQDVLQLEGVVVTGQGTSVRRRNLANAVATVKSPLGGFAEGAFAAVPAHSSGLAIWPPPIVVSSVWSCSLTRPSDSGNPAALWSAFLSGRSADGLTP